MVGTVITDELASPLIVNVPALAVTDPRTTKEVLRVTVDVLAMPLTVSVPALAVTDPCTTVESLMVTTDELARPFTVNVPALAVIDPSTTNPAHFPVSTASRQRARRVNSNQRSRRKS